MCGIAGTIQLDGAAVQAPLLKRMTDAIAHRGPDGEGQWIEGNVGLGHRRLAIIDLSAAGQQPMLSSDGRYVITYNGELYNFRELRVELQAAGYVFRSGTDTEVVLNALAHWGVDALRRFNGMFAFGLWDRRERRLLLARDRYGIKPLYVSRRDGVFSFASEQKAILAGDASAREVDTAGLLEYLTFQNFFTPRTLLRDMRLLPAGHFAVLDLAQASPELRESKYWDYKFREPERHGSPEEYVEELQRLFRQAVDRQLVADVELGSYLSGGMDSGAITAIAARQYPELKTFTCGFDLSSASGIELAFDERVRAEAMSAIFKTEHYEMVLKAGDMEKALPRLARHLEEPRVGQSYPNYYAAQLASKFVKVVMSGAGGDELFAGYPWRYYRGAAAGSFDDYVDRYFGFWQRLVPEERMPGLMAPVWPEVKDVSTREIFRNVFDGHDNRLDRAEDYINHSLYFEARTFLHGLLVVEDKLSMAHGLETRVPFLDNDLVDFAMACPVGMKLNNLQSAVRIDENEPGDKNRSYFLKTNDGKKILRDMARRYVPDSIADATKQGFSAPDASWFKGQSMSFVEQRLLKGRPMIYELIDRGEATSLVREHLDGVANRRLFIWSLLNLEQWMNEFHG